MGKAKTAQGEKKIMPLISVIMGVHNSETDMLLSAVGSVLSQSVSDIELIICDDGSENGIGKTLDSIKDSRVKLISFKENKGLAAALNACIDVQAENISQGRTMTTSAFREGLKNRPSTLKITEILISSEQIASFIRRVRAYTASV